MSNIYISSAQYTAVAAWTTLTAFSSVSNGGRGDYIRQTSPALNSERVFRCTTSGTSGVSEPTWTLTKNATTSDGSVVWTECTGQEADQISGTWKAPHARLSNAMAATWGAAGDSFYVGENHAETQASAMTLTSPGTMASPCRIICVDHAGTVPPVSADLRNTATVSTTGASAISTAGVVSLCRGIIFSSGDAANVANCQIGGTWNLLNCAVRLGNTSASSTIRPSSGVFRQVWENTTVQFGATGQGLLCSGEWIWKNTPTAVSGATFPTTLFSSSAAGNAFFEGVDLIALSGKTLIPATMVARFDLVLKDCKLPAAITPAAVQTTQSGGVTFVRADSGATNYRTEKYAYEGQQTIETTIVRTGGASDGTTPIAWKLLTTANAKPDFPYTSLPISIWNDTPASNVVVTVFGIWGGGAVPNNDDVWIEVEYLGSSATPQGSFATTGKADVLAANAATTADGGSAWGGSTTAFKIIATLSSPQPGLKGPITVRVKVGAASQTIYIDPKVVLS